MRHITYLIILNLLFLNVYNAESQITKKPVFTKATYEPLKVTQTTKVCDPESITLSASATNYCKLSKILNFAYQIDYNNDGTFEASGTGNQAVLGNHKEYRFGTHKIKWLVTDGCGGLSTCSKLVTIEKAISSKKPTPIAKLLSIELMPNNCTAVLESTKVNNFSYDDCTAAKDLRFKIAKAGDYHPNMTLNEVLALNEFITFTKKLAHKQLLYL
ncbi:MAG: hypothetical protein IPL95_19770 [Saprospiraceae bacterium]|nr:hypothetical protein [Saprospiraceae bacterium]